jgi:hypothetical protein
MPRFYFHIYFDKMMARDEDGMELQTFLDALVEAEQSARDIREEAEGQGLCDADAVVQIVEASGTLFDVVPVFPEKARPRVMH